MISAAQLPREISFLTQNGDRVPACSWEAWSHAVRDLQACGLTPLQMAEACGFSSAMVIRFALGLSSSGGAVTVLASDSFFGWVTLACARHLLNGGSSVHLVVIPGRSAASEHWQRSLLVAERLGGHIHEWSTPQRYTEVAEKVESCHNVICGLSDAEETILPWTWKVIEFMNESAIPVHTIGTPLGLSPNRGPCGSDLLYASSTLSLGLPFEALHHDPDLIGRHYLCDMSWGLKQYAELGFKGEPLFAEQPVIRLVMNTA
jgi:NAD(P)H-hydrate repair Nnr-like enzyme with NAD(P)H-hydrate epimerase domain